MRSARRSVFTALLALGVTTVGCATLIGLPEENDDLPQGGASDASSEDVVSLQDAADSTTDASDQDADVAAEAAIDAAHEADAPVDGPGPDTGPTAGEIIKLASGTFHACVIRADGDGGTRTDCWGQNDHGELGRGSFTGPSAPSAVLEPTTSNPIRTFVDIAAGDGHTCAIDTSHDVYCWGSNTTGQLGAGSQQYVARAAKVPGLSNVQKLSLGSGLSMAYDSSDTLWWWGMSLLDPGGAYEATITSKTPLEVTPPLGKLKGVSNTLGHACVVNDPAGEVRCWGRNGTLQSSSSEATCSVCTQPDGGKSAPCVKEPSAIPGLAAGVIEVRTGHSATCALMSDQGVWCWGDGYSGQLGDRLDSNIALTCGGNGKIAGAVIDAVGYTTIAVGYEQACGLKTDRSVVCWGKDSYESLGNGDGGTSLAPAPVLVSGAPLTNIDFLTAQGGSTCAARKTGEVFCWGEDGGNFQWMMDGSNADQPEATQIPLPPMQ